MNPTFMTLLGQMISFAILIWFTVKFIWPPLMSAIEERQQKIAAGLAAADNAQKDLAQAQDKVNEELKAARSKANEIIEQAHQRANQLIDAAKPPVWLPTVGRQTLHERTGSTAPRHPAVVAASASLALALVPGQAERLGPPRVPSVLEQCSPRCAGMAAWVH